MKNFISLGISGIGLALVVSSGQAMANEGSIVSIVSQTPTGAFHTLSKILTEEHAAPIPMTVEQLNAVKGKQNFFSENLRKEILASIQALVNQQFGQPIPQGGSLSQEILASTQEIVNQGLSQLTGF